MSKPGFAQRVYRLRTPDGSPKKQKQASGQNPCLAPAKRPMAVNRLDLWCKWLRMVTCFPRPPTCITCFTWREQHGFGAGYAASVIHRCREDPAANG